MIKIILIIAVVIIINSPFQPGNFSTGSTTVKLCVILFILKLKKNASFPTWSKSTPG